MVTPDHSLTNEQLKDLLREGLGYLWIDWERADDTDTETKAEEWERRVKAALASPDEPTPNVVVATYKAKDCICEQQFDLTVPGGHHHRECPLRHRPAEKSPTNEVTLPATTDKPCQCGLGSAATVDGRAGFHILPSGWVGQCSPQKSVDTSSSNEVMGFSAPLGSVDTGGTNIEVGDWHPPEKTAPEVPLPAGIYQSGESIPDTRATTAVGNHSGRSVESTAPPVLCTDQACEAQKGGPHCHMPPERQR